MNGGTPWLGTVAPTSRMTDARPRPSVTGWRRWTQPRTRWRQSRGTAWTTNTASTARTTGPVHTVAAPPPRPRAGGHGRAANPGAPAAKAGAAPRRRRARGRQPREELPDRGEV